MTRIYDPLGIAGPVVVAAKIFIQQLWEKEMSWDEELPQAQSTSWLEFRTALNILNNTRIPRHIFDDKTPGWENHCPAIMCKIQSCSTPKTNTPKTGTLRRVTRSRACKKGRERIMLRRQTSISLVRLGDCSVLDQIIIIITTDLCSKPNHQDTRCNYQWSKATCQFER